MNKVEELENEIERLKSENDQLRREAEELKAELNRPRRGGATKVAPEIYKSSDGSLFLRPGL